MTTLPAVAISRLSVSGVVADGGDPLSRQLLKHLGWIETGSGHEPWYHTALDMSRAWQNAEATKAAVLLTAAGYPVQLDPSLGTPPDQPAFVPSPAPEEADPALGVLSLIDRLKGTDSPQDAAEIAATAFTPDTGVLARLQELVEAGAEWVRDHGPEDTDDLHDVLDDASAVLYDLTLGLATVPEDFRTLPTDHSPMPARATAARLTSPAMPTTHTHDVPSTATRTATAPDEPRRRAR
ncbi:hypothetical protein ABZW30_08235 [Kitasatospora sp. NPDC004669]|uniref:hypothetical protein n=1 Tax=Kitasatospora sp. NPDC004669 TaxID=3154555 RepID=UPI0033BA9007